MKTQGKNRRRLVLLTALVISMLWTIQAQPGKGKNQEPGKGKCIESTCRHLLDLTEDQKVKMNNLRLTHIKEMQVLRNQIGEKKARLRTLETADTPDMNAINGTIEDMGKLKTEMMKKRAAHKQEVRKLLTEEQRIIFDTSYKYNKKGPHKQWGNKDFGLNGPGVCPKGRF